MKLTKTKKILLLGATLGILTTAVIIPVVLINQNDNQEEKNKEEVLKVIKILEEKSLSERQIELSSNSKDKIVANNQQEIIKKIKELIGSENLKSVKVEILMQNDQEISTSFQEIKVKISKGNYSQEVKKEKTIFVKRSRTSIELALIELNEVKDSLKALRTKVVKVYTSEAIDQKISTNKLEILKAIEKISGYSKIDFKGVNIKVKNSEELLPTSNQQPIPITLVLSNSEASTEIIDFKAKQMSSLEIARVDLNDVKTNLESLELKIVQVNTTSAIDHKIVTNKVKILEEIQKLDGYSNINLKGVSIEVKDSETLLPASNQDPISIILVLRKNGISIEISAFKAKSLSSQEILDNTQVVNLVKSNLESLSPQIVDVYTSGAIDQKVTTNKIEILKSIKKISGYSDIDLKGATIEVKNSEDVLPSNDQSPIAITLVVSKPGVAVEVSGFSAKQMSLSQTANIDLNLVKKDLESLSVKIVEVDSSESVNQKITTNKDKILEEIKKLNGYSSINLRSVNVEVKNSETLLPPNDQDPVPITLVLSKVNALPNNVELIGFRGKQQSYVIKNIKDKIIDKDILIAPSVSTLNQNEVQSAILEQLKIENDTLIDEDLEKITTNIKSLTKGVRIQVQLTITFNLKSEVINIYVEKINLLKGSNITNGQGGTFFEDSFNNLWAMGQDSPLQVFRKGNNQWTNNVVDIGLTKNSNITNGENGTIFQDDFGNLWAMSKGTPLQVLRVNDDANGYDEITGWKSATNSGLTNGSNITDGNGGTIFQDEFKNLWTVGYNSKLQVLKTNNVKDGYVNTGWVNDNSNNGDVLLRNSNIITNSAAIKIFQDDFGNLWTLGYKTTLQVLRVNSQKNGYDEITGWTSATNSGLLNNSNIVKSDVVQPTIFQDKFKNLWSMSKDTPLQVLRVNDDGNGYDEITGWTSATNSGLTNGSNITNGEGGEIFQDSFGNLWSAGSGTKLQVLKVKSNGSYVNSWTNDNNEQLLNGFNIIGKWWIIFQDKSKNLWVFLNKNFGITKNDKRVWVLKKESNSYTNLWNENEEVPIMGSSTNDFSHRIKSFIDSNGNIWIMSNNIGFFVILEK